MNDSEHFDFRYFNVVIPNLQYNFVITSTDVRNFFTDNYNTRNRSFINFLVSQISVVLTNVSTVRVYRYRKTISCLFIGDSKLLFLHERKY